MKAFVLSFLFVLCFVSTYANEPCGWYCRGFGGVNYISIPSSENVKLQAKGGYAVGASVGYKFSRTFRLDAEFTYRANDFDRFIIKTDEGKVSLPIRGFVYGFTYIANVIFDVPFDWAVLPYFGGGVGGHSDRGQMDFSHLGEGPEFTVYKLKRDDGFSYQGLAGICLPLLRKTDFRIEYRYLDDLIENNKPHNHTIALTCQHVF